MNDHEGHSRVRGEMIEEAFESVQSASGSSDANDVEPGFCFARRHCSSGQGEHRQRTVADGCVEASPLGNSDRGDPGHRNPQGSWAQMMVRYVVSGPRPALGILSPTCPYQRISCVPSRLATEWGNRPAPGVARRVLLSCLDATRDGSGDAVRNAERCSLRR